jgi:hypothetical protein
MNQSKRIEIDVLWQQAMRDSIIDGEDFTRYHFAKRIAAKCAEIADTAEPYKSADLIKKHFGVEE